MKTKLALCTLGAVLSLGLVACPSPTPIKTDFAQPTTIEGTIADYVDRPNNPARIEFRAKKGTLLAFANATQTGTFSLTLPSADIVTSKLEESELLVFFTFIAGVASDDPKCTGELTLNPVVPTYLLLQTGFTQGSFDTDRNISSGTVSLTNGQPNIDQDFWIYASSPTQLTGARTCPKFKSRASLFLKKGWNAANFKLLTATTPVELVIQSVEPTATTWRSNPKFFGP